VARLEPPGIYLVLRLWFFFSASLVGKAPQVPQVTQQTRHGERPYPLVVVAAGRTVGSGENEPPCLFWTVRVVGGPRKKRTNDALTLKDPCASSPRLLDLRGREGVCVRWAGLAAWEYMDGEPPGYQGLDARGGGNSPPTWATGPSGEIF
ncbi:unnamed protein product, partial [Pylaiella littoralis]